VFLDVQQLQPFAAELRHIEKHPREIPARVTVVVISTKSEQVLRPRVSNQREE